MNQEKSRMHYAWKIMIALIFLKIGEGAINCNLSNFITPVVAEFHCKVSDFALTMSINAIGMALFYVTAAKTITTKKVGLVLGIATLCECIGMALMSTYKAVYLFYISGAIIGISGAFTGFVVTPILINMWFKKKAATVLGVVIAAGSAATMLFQMLSATFITSFGWRTAYLVLSGIAFVLMVPMMFFIMKTPEEVGCKPYGDDGAPERQCIENTQNTVTGMTRSQAFRAPAFWLAWLCCVLISYGCGVPYYVANYATMELGKTISFGATCTVCVNVGTILGSLLLGQVNDRFGVKSGLCFGAGISVLAFAMLLFSNSQLIWLILAGSALSGVSTCMYSVQAPLLAQEIVGQRDYSSIWSVMMIANSLIGGGLNFTIGYFYDYGGTYKGAFMTSMAMFLAAIMIGLVATNMVRKKRTAIAA